MHHLKIHAREVSTEREVQSLFQTNPAVLFLVNDNKNRCLGQKSDQTFSHYVHLKPCAGLDLTSKVAVGLYNGKFGVMDASLNADSFVQKHFLGDALSNQMAMYLAQELSSFPEEDKSYLDSMMVALGDYLLKLLCQQDRRAKQVKGGITPFQVRNVVNFIRQNIDKQVSTQDLADVTGQSVYHFIRMFKRTTGETPHQCVIRLKMEHAKELLLDSEENIIHVGMGVGFDNPSHFSQLFKSSFGIAPLKFRKSFQNNVMTA